ncbi:uncharacterized protein LOC144905663 [Branchiostoma floridae x Branchiostoma belcheri]
MSPNSYCSEHAARAAMWRQRANRRKRPVDNSGPLLEHLLHYSPELEKSLGRALPQANVISSSNQPSRVLDYDYSSESDQEPIQVDQAWRGDGDSDAESIDSEQEDPLKHAGVYTAEEVALITREKLIRLQSLYIDQFKRLQHLLKEKRRKYLTAKKMEQDILGSVIPSTDEDLDSSDKEKLRTLHATKRYRKRHGAEALLQSRSNERRIAASESHLVTKPTPPPRCNIIIDGERCSHNVVPMSRFCLQHILHDPHQVLFQHCSHSTGGIEICDKPVAMGMDRTTCVLHSPLPPQRFKIPEKEEEMIVEEVKPDVMQIDVEEDDNKPVEVTALEGKGQTQNLPETAKGGAEGAKEESLGNQETTGLADETPATSDQPTTQASQPYLRIYHLKKAHVIFPPWIRREVKGRGQHGGPSDLLQSRLLFRNELTQKVQAMLGGPSLLASLVVRCRSCCRLQRRTFFWRSPAKLSYDVVRPAEVSPRREVPRHIQKPPYAENGIAPLWREDIEIKDEKTMVGMRAAGKLARKILVLAGQSLQVGMTTDEIDRLVHESTVSHGAYPSPLNYGGYPKSVCTSVNNVACHGIPDSRPLQNGDIINIDVTVYYNGFHGDTSETFLVGNVDEAGCTLVDVARRCRDKAITVCSPGTQFCEIGRTISSVAKETGLTVSPNFIGHGIGAFFHGPPEINHIANSLPGTMEAGMAFTIEPIIMEGSHQITILEDGWTAVSVDNGRSAQFEHTVLITEEGVEILTA